jgi:hypothetical protein
MNWRGFGRKRLWTNFKALFPHSPEGTEENHEKVSEDSLSAGRDLNPRPPGYEETSLFTAKSFMLPNSHDLFNDSLNVCDDD